VQAEGVKGGVFGVTQVPGAGLCVQVPRAPHQASQHHPYPPVALVPGTVSAHEICSRHDGISSAVLAAEEFLGLTVLHPDLPVQRSDSHGEESPLDCQLSRPGHPRAAQGPRSWAGPAPIVLQTAQICGKPVFIDTCAKVLSAVQKELVLTTWVDA
jgi:hypothetical protein